MSEGSPENAAGAPPKRRKPLVTPRDIGRTLAGMAVVIATSVITHHVLNRRPPCPYPSRYSAVDAMSWLAQAEGEAVVAGDTAMLGRIYAAHAQVHNRTTPGTSPARFADHYRRLLSQAEFLAIQHHSFDDFDVDGEVGRMTSGNFLVLLTPDGTVQTWRNPERWDRWTFAKDARGCWAVSRLEFGPPTPPATPAQPGTAAGGANPAAPGPGPADSGAASPRP